MKTKLIFEEKKVLRQNLLAERKTLSAEERKSGAAEIRRGIHSWSVFRQAESVMLYLALPLEPDIDGLLEQAFIQGKNVAVPQIMPGEGRMEAVEWTPALELEKGRFAIRQIPEAQRKLVAPQNIELVIVPCLALDRRGFRLGMGGGYYDRFLPQLSARTVLLGVCWHHQLQDLLPVEEHDRRLHYVITEKEFFEGCHNYGN